MRILALTFAGLAVLGCASEAQPQGPSHTTDQGGLETLDFRKVVNSAKEKVFPAVVFIKCIAKTLEEGKEGFHPVAGSGVVISPEGEVLTNWHVVDKAVEIRCMLHDGRPLDAKLLGSDKDTDLALLKLGPSPAPIPCAKIGDSSVLKEGDFVMAMGAPWGFSRSVSIGIISCARRFLSEISEYSLWLQTDASISPGNSGGPLVNTAGEVIGINARGLRGGGEMGFAIPSETFKHIVGQIRESGKVDWSWTGLELQPLKDFDRNIYFEGVDGVMVAEVDPDSPASEAGFRRGDRILSVNGSPLNGLSHEELPGVRRFLGLLPKGKPARAALLRGGRTLALDIVPRAKGKVEGEELDCPRWDLTVKTINQFDKPDLYYHRKSGVFIFGVKNPGNASAAGLRPDDIMLAVDKKNISTLDDVKTVHKAAVAGVQSRHTALFTILRNGLMKQVILDFSRDYSKE